MPPPPPSAMHEQQSSQSRWYHNPWLVFAVALALRSSFVFVFHFDRFMVADRLPIYGGPFEFGAEMGRIAASLVSGHGYGNPFYGHTGPSAWVPPLYPFIIAGVFRLFGTYTVAAAQALILINAAFGALMVFPMHAIAKRCFGPRVAAASIWFWAVWPFTMAYTTFIWATSLNALLFTCVLALCVRMRGIGQKSGAPASPATVNQWLLLGFLWGLIALTNPSLLLMAPASFIWILLPTTKEPHRRQLRRQIMLAALSFGVFLCCIAPWTIRNALVFHRFIPIRSELGVEINLGNDPYSHGLIKAYEQPFNSPRQYALYRSMGEIAYCRMRGAEALASIHKHSGTFFTNTLLRIYYYWFGLPGPSGPVSPLGYASRVNFIFTSLCGLLGLLLAFRNRLPAAGLFASAIAICPLTYYLITVAARFRYPLDPVLYILTFYLWTSAEESNRVRWLTPSWWKSILLRNHNTVNAR